MAQLTAIVDELLTDASSMYKPEEYISEEILPYIGVDRTTGKLAKYGQQHLRIENSLVAGRGKFRRVETIVRSQSSYNLDGHGLEGLVTEDDYENVQEPYDAERDETIGLTTVLWLEKEQSLANAITATATMTQNVTLSGTSQFSDYDNSDPIGRFNTGRKTVKDGCGFFPNSVTMSDYVAQQLRFHPQLLDALGFRWNRPGGLKNEELMSALWVQKIFVGSAMYNTAKEGQTDTLGAIWGKDMVFAYIPDQAAPYQVSLGYRLGIKGMQPREVYKWPERNPPNSTSILVRDKYQFFLSNVLAGYLIKAAIA